MMSSPTQVGPDPIEFARKLLADHPRIWRSSMRCRGAPVGGKTAPKGVYTRPLQTHRLGSYVAGVCRSPVSDKGAVKIHRIVAAHRSGPRG